MRWAAQIVLLVALIAWARYRPLATFAWAIAFLVIDQLVGAAFRRTVRSWLSPPDRFDTRWAYRVGWAAVLATLLVPAAWAMPLLVAGQCVLLASRPRRPRLHEPRVGRDRIATHIQPYSPRPLRLR